ncbi:hypothetical protein MAR_023887 [Mya arenaria]|uniref:Uncharacterized protein n=1 Tax=Mya arenaria TaxID=6604 RepID=A0ABY7DSE5_MYAAR|nr:hypothetical protein MAR_023887 [Mya arenaria]
MGNVINKLCCCGGDFRDKLLNLCGYNRKNKDSFNESETSSLIDDDDQHSKDKESMYGTTPPMLPSPSPSPIKKRHSKFEQTIRSWIPGQRNEYNKPTIQSLKYDKERLETEVKKLQNRIEEEQVERQTLFSEKEGLIHELEELRTRLCSC